MLRIEIVKLTAEFFLFLISEEEKKEESESEDDDMGFGLFE